VNQPKPTDRALVDAHGVDFTRPVLPQLDALGDRYWEWSHRHLTPSFRARLAAARRAERWPDSFPIFAQPWLEVQTHIAWQQVLVFWGLVVIALAVLAPGRGAVAPAAAPGWWLGGFLLWTLVEYLLHRKLFHRVPRTPVQRRLHFLIHGIHHKDPLDRTRLVFPLLSGVVIAAGLFAGLWLLLPLGAAMLAMSGLLAGYLAYDLGHYAWHHAAPRAGWLRRLKRHHLAHHFSDVDSRFGVSQPLWDHVFGTGGSRVD
jgi:sterol desaturase/sphingolipid hydroxylase (fatty acid hydroxylase superfamily)